MPHACTNGFDASFVQLSNDDLAHDLLAWKRELQVLRATGVRTIVLQYTGDEHGSYDARQPGLTPVRSLLAAARDLGLEVYLGLYADPSWPDRFDLKTRTAAPLDDPAGRAWLTELSGSFASFAGFYIPHEIDEQTWATAKGAPLMAAFLGRTARVLRHIAPHKPIALAPFYAVSRPPAAYARFWKRVLAARPIDILMLQDGAGARGTPDATIVEMLRALASVLDGLDIELWSVLEVFRQVGGSPVNDSDFAAVPADYARIRASMAVERPWVRRLIAFSVLDYMHPARGQAHKQLFDAYRADCMK
jgi:hypothetical protein